MGRLTRKIGATYRVQTDDLYLEKERYRNIKTTTELMLIENLIMGEILKIGATYRVRTDDLYLGKVSLYQLS